MRRQPVADGRQYDAAAPRSVTLRAAAEMDCRNVWLWRNDPETRRASFDPAPIPFETHARWFAESLTRPDRKLYIVTAGDRAVGVARLDLDAAAAVVSLHLAPEWRGRKIGPGALRALVELAFGPLGLVRMVASIKSDNARSLAAFEEAGFVRIHEGAIIELERRPDAR